MFDLSSSITGGVDPEVMYKHSMYLRLRLRLLTKQYKMECYCTARVVVQKMEVAELTKGGCLRIYSESNVLI